MFLPHVLLRIIWIVAMPVLKYNTRINLINHSMHNVMDQVECIRCKVCTTTIERTEFGIGSADKLCIMAIQSATGLVMLTTLTSQCSSSVLQTITLVECPATITTSTKIGGGSFYVALLHTTLPLVAALRGM